MYVRAFDQSTKSYYKSIVYGTVGIGWYLQYILYNPHTDTFQLVDYLDKSVSPAKPLVEIIRADHPEFVICEGSRLLKFKYFCKTNQIPHMDAKRIMGYPEVCENHEFLSEILARGSVPAAAVHIPLRNPTDSDQWNYILTQADADDFMRQFAGFHDSTLETISYSESYGESSARAIFDNRCWFGVAELCFEGVQLLKICPASQNHSREIFEASLIVENESIFWADAYMQTPDPAYEGSIIQALSLKWRKL